MAFITIGSVGVTSVVIDSYVLDTLLPDLVGHDRQPSAFLVYLYLWRHTIGSDQVQIQASLQDITLGTGVSKRAVQAALGLLVRRKLLSVARAGITAVPTYTVRRPWVRAQRAASAAGHNR
ncbi:MAG: helix-turn-helix domain-containing protein [bacterium]